MPNHFITIRAYISLARLNQPIGIYLVLWPALWALWIASEGTPNLSILAIFVFGAILMRSAGCVINDYVDRSFDEQVQRTCKRPIASGLISPKGALFFLTMLCLMAFSLVLNLNRLTILLSFGGVLLAVLYPFMKRHTYWPQAFLGAAFAWAIPMAFAAATNEIPWQLCPIFVATMVWSLIYDTAYAISDIQDDLKISVKSTAILFGEKLVLWVGLFQLMMLSLLSWVGLLFELHSPYYLSLVLVAGWFGYDLFRLNLKDSKIAFVVFLQSHWIGLIILFGIVADYGMY